MNIEQLERRQDRAQQEPLVISKTDEGFRVFSPVASPMKSYVVSGSPEAPACTCPDFQYHQGNPQWRCKHILAVLNGLETPPGNGTPSDPYEAEERRAIQEESREGERTFPPPPPPASNPSVMVLKRSVSPDGKIDSLSVEISCPLGELSAQGVLSKAKETLSLQSDIVGTFLGGQGTNGKGEKVNGGDHIYALPATMLSVGGMDSKWGRRTFITVDVQGRSLKLFGAPKQLGEQISAAGFPNFNGNLVEGVTLNLPCRVITKPSPDGKYLNVEKVLPIEAFNSNGR